MFVFEHAYITQWGLNRDKYIDAFFQNIDWGSVQKRYIPNMIQNLAFGKAGAQNFDQTKSAQK